MGAIKGSGSLLDWIDDVPPNIKEELRNRYDELTRLQTEQVQEGTTVPQLYGSLSRFIANPSTVSVETYKRMLDTDETIGAGIDFLNLAMIARFGDYKHEVPEVQKFVRRALMQMEGSWHENLDEMLSAEWSGFSVTEQVWTYKSNFDGAPAFVPQKLVTYPPLTVVFAVNRHGEVLPDGVYQYQRFHNTFFNSYMYGISNGDLDGFRPDLFASIGDYPYPVRIAADLTYLTVKIPKDKVIHLRSSSTGKFGNAYGRALSLDTPMLTLNGWSTMGNLTINDYVFDDNGKLCQITGKSEIWKNRDIYRVHFSDGSYIDADENHQWPVTKTSYERQKKRKGKLLTTKEIYNHMISLDKKVNEVLAIKLSDNLKLPKRGLLIPPYLLGQWLGDGNSSGARISTHMDDVEELKKELNNSGYETTETRQNGSKDNKGRYFGILSNYQKQLRILGLINNKHIPEEYLLASEDQRTELLQGLMDSDGYITPSGYKWKDGYVGKGGNAEFVNTNKNLVDGVSFLIRSLGNYCTVKEKKRYWGDRRLKDTWTVRFTPYKLKAFKLKRKAERLLINDKNHKAYHYIRNIEKRPKGETVCIEVNSPSHLFLAGKSLIPTHNSILRRAYKNWVLKDAFLKMWVVAADRKGTPLIVGYAAPNDTVRTMQNGDGRTEEGLGRADVAMAETMKTIHNSSFIVFPGRKGETYDIEAVQVQGDMNIFKEAIDYFNGAEMRSLLIPPLAMSSGDGVGSYALGQEHHKIFNSLIDGKLKTYKQELLDQFISKVVSYNFPKHVWEKHGFGEFVLEEYDPEIMEKLTNIYRGLTETGYMSPDSQIDLDHVREKMGMKKTQAIQGFGEENSTDPNDASAPSVEKNIPEDQEDKLPPNYRV